MSATAAPRGGKYDVRERFRQLAAEWKEQSRHMSSAAQMAMLKPYQQIIGMGEVAMPLLLEELQRDPDQWFWALTWGPCRHRAIGPCCSGTRTSGSGAGGDHPGKSRPAGGRRKGPSDGGGVGGLGQTAGVHGRMSWALVVTRSGNRITTRAAPIYQAPSAAETACGLFGIPPHAARIESAHLSKSLSATVLGRGGIGWSPWSTNRRGMAPSSLP